MSEEQGMSGSTSLSSATPVPPPARRPEKVTPEIQAALPQRRPWGLHAVFGFFSAVPVPAFGVVDRVVAASAIRWFPVMGALVGLVSVLPALVVRAVGGSPLLAAGVYLTCLALLTGAIHLDGIADTADGLGSRKPAEEALEIMRKPDMGPMGVATLVLVLLLEATALAGFESWRGLLAAGVLGPALGRLALWDATTPAVPMARKQGFGALFGGVTARWQAWVGTLLGAGAAAGAGWWIGGLTDAVYGFVTFSLARLVAVFWMRHLIRRLSGMTGDTFGSIVELTTAVVWVLLSLVW